MKNAGSTKQNPFSLRLSPEERAELEARANGRPVGSYVRECLFAANDNRPRPRRAPSKHKAELAAVLAKLGRAEFSSSLRAIAEAARIGALPVSPQLEADLEQACRDVAEMKLLLMKALGIQER
ncbi:hypothetical protein A7A08_02342 [Methyloligella halotolerans]|uniref:Uncharacterized protein n=1 Tax=Methyloligella halotolerans TaxID=1177755 RepID=A0A1E2RWS3_9HYPH|nr:hypothetical protein [Methyloligella halotolerans]ODA66575.1 hypothetical protein A7A08_02342 [Methyloligella halotolerans]